jgi:hypothetical protein
MPHNVFRPHTFSQNRVIVSKGKGVGAVLLGNVGSGGASSWTDMESYMKDVGAMRPSPKTLGSGLGGELERKLSKLKVEGRKKPKNITLDL